MHTRPHKNLGWASKRSPEDRDTFCTLKAGAVFGKEGTGAERVGRYWGGRRGRSQNAYTSIIVGVCAPATVGSASDGYLKFMHRVPRGGPRDKKVMTTEIDKKLNGSLRAVGFTKVDTCPWELKFCSTSLCVQY